MGSIQVEDASLRHVGERNSMPIAIVGMACRFSGIATDQDGLWHMLTQGLSGWSSLPDTRFKMDSFQHPAAGTRGTFNTQGLHLLQQDIAHFDHQFFNISPTEAESIDPQHRLMLEVAYEAFENAGIPAKLLAGSNTGVYCALTNHDYEKIQSTDARFAPKYLFTGCGPAMASNRISYFFDLEGPSITLDTACSGNLVAVHEACQAIRFGEINQALVGGTNLILDPDWISAMSSVEVLSDHGRCYTFDKRANGFGRGDGVAAVVLKPLDDAIQAGDPIQGVIRATSIGQDGRTPGIMMPSQSAQVKMMQRAYEQAGLSPGDTPYIETHGTGTQAGDVVEFGAIEEFFGRGRAYDSVLYAGSIKTNIGHTESTAGLAGLIKATLAVRNEMIPPNFNFLGYNPALGAAESFIKVPETLQPWPQNQPCRASINSFGYGGTNAHCIVESSKQWIRDASHEHGEACEESSLSGTGSGRRLLFPLSHSRKQGIGRLAASLKQYILDHATSSKGRVFVSLAHTLGTRRSNLRSRVCLSAATWQELVSCLDNIINKSTFSRTAFDDPRICFVFTGQGAQWAQMGQELLATYPLFAQRISYAENCLRMIGAEWSLVTEITRPPNGSRINEAEISQPCCTSIQLALVDLLRSWNINPQIVCGHSSGEIAAAYAAGILSSLDALRIAYYRGRIVGEFTATHPHVKGGMLAAAMDLKQAEHYITQAAASFAGAVCSKVVVACINSPSSVTLSGDKDLLERIRRDLDNGGIFNRPLSVDVAYHSHHMEMVQQEYLQAIRSVVPLQPRRDIRMVSSVTGKEIDWNEMGPGYWVQNLVSPVHFTDAFEGALKFGMDIALEIGPHSTLKGPVQQIIKQSEYSDTLPSYDSVLLRKIDAVHQILGTVGRLFSLGVDIRFNEINDPCGARAGRTLTNLPSYNWDHSKTHWNESRASRQYRHRQFPLHELLGIPSQDSLSLEPRWYNYLRLSELPWLAAHKVNNQVVFPLSGYICMALEASRQMTIISGKMWENNRCRFREIVPETALLIPDTTNGVEVFFTIRPYIESATELSSDWKEFRVFSTTEDDTTVLHCRGLLSIEKEGSSNEVEGYRETNMQMNEDYQRFQDQILKCRKTLDTNQMYKYLNSIGLSYCPPFQNLTETSVGDMVAFSKVTTPDTKKHMPAQFERNCVCHPATLDAFFQLTFAALVGSEKMNSSKVVSRIEELDISSAISLLPGSSFVSCATVEAFGSLKQRANILAGDYELKNPSLLHVNGIFFTSVALGSDTLASDDSNICYQVRWAPDVTSATSQAVNELCAKGLPEGLGTEEWNMYDKYLDSVIQHILATISHGGEDKTPPHCQNLLRWMRSRKSGFPDASLASLRDRVQSYGVVGEALVQIGDHMLDILRGQMDPLAAWTKDDLLYRFYQTDSTDRCHIQLANYTAQLQFKQPHMRVLEVGAGTASATLPVLEALIGEDARHSRDTGKLDTYVFTDISSGFFENAKDKLAAWTQWVEFQKLNIEKPTGEQGFTQGSFDLIIASNVLHATESMTNTLRNVRRLLKPGGKLALVEITEPHDSWTFLMGVLPGWWLGVGEGRVNSPLLQLSAWDSVLSETGFSGVDIEMRDYESSPQHQLSVIISTATVEQPVIMDPLTVQIIASEQDNTLAMEISNLIQSSGLVKDAKKSNLDDVVPMPETIYVILLEALRPFLVSCGESDFQKIKNILLQAKGTVWVTRGGAVEVGDPQMGLITGLARTLRSEQEGLKIVTLDLDPLEESEKKMAENIYSIFINSLCAVSEDTAFVAELECAIREDQLLIPRIIEDASTERYVQDRTSRNEPRIIGIRESGRSLELAIKNPALLESLYWRDSPVHNIAPRENEVRVEMEAFSLNFKDIMIAMGQLDGLTNMLFEGGGRVVDVGERAKQDFQIGDRVCVTDTRCLATTSNIDSNYVHRVPDEMSLYDASAIQMVYTTALYALRDVARLQKGESILIHSGMGALGQAAIAIARYLGAGDIFVTVGNVQKKALLTERFEIPPEFIYSSRGVAFGRGIRRQTNGKGVDVVLNSLTGEPARESQKSLANFGRFIEVGKRPLLTNSRMELQSLENNGTFAVVDLTHWARHKPSEMKKLCATVLDLIHTKKIPLLSTITVKPISRIEDAFRIMQAGKHMGKFVLKIDDSSQGNVLASPTPCQLRGDCAYLFVGGLGGLGRAIIKHFARIGAKNIVIMARSGASGDRTKQAFIQEMTELGLNLIIHKGSVVNLHDVQRIQAVIGSLTIRGIINGAMELQDSPVNNLSYSQWKAATSPKIEGTMNLERSFGGSLDFFILLSSTGGIIGSKSQANYNAGCTFQDAFARYRASLNRPVRSIDLCGINSVGHAAGSESAATHVTRQGIKMIDLENLLALLDHAIAHPFADEPTNSQSVIGIRRQDQGQQFGTWVKDPRFSHTLRYSSQRVVNGDRAEEYDLASLPVAPSQAAATKVIECAIVAKLSKLLDTNAADISLDQSVSSYGVDSLIAVELRSWILKYLQAQVQTLELLGASSIQSLCQLITKRSQLVLNAKWAEANHDMKEAT
ncbi:hypothetical protein BJX63DRAFT_427619 [Aspergillus granulosus]|uniref:Uncharacterized protein n=1 Tax=Aspergillus granulosus TaxID=176169 RepID=A0ABR4I1X3_9EURO